MRFLCQESDPNGLPRAYGIPLPIEIPVLKRARISNFRWHDLRLHFASRLVQHGVPPNTVRDLLGHSSVGMSLRYAHLAPDQRRETVAKLNEKPVLALSMRLKWEGFSAASSYSTKVISGPQQHFDLRL
jgi:hypothetical protein